MWGATAYKGADGPSMDLPDLDRRQTNALAWAEVAQRYQFKGLAATAWSRYSSHRVQNEPIDGSLDSLLNVGVILHDGQTPGGGIEACREALCDLGEGERFTACHDVLQDLADAREAAWRDVQSLLEQQWLERQEPHRRKTNLLQWSLDAMDRELQRLDKASDAVRDALKGLVPDIWIEEYIRERVEPVRDLRSEHGARIS
jgi:hypothetical protein